MVLGVFGVVMVYFGWFVVLAYVNEARDVEEFENVLSAVNVLAVYVFGIVDEA